MTAAREAFVLPAVFLMVFLLSALRITDTTTALVPPSPFALVLGALVLRVVVQSGALAPDRLLSSSRSSLANLNGLVVFIALWAAAEVIAVLIPESGVPLVTFSVFFFILLLNTAAAAPDRERLLRSLAVTFGAAYVLKFVVLYQLSAPGAGSIKRMLQALLDSVTLGALIQPVPHPVSAYLALLAVLLFLIGVSAAASSTNVTIMLT